MNGEMKNVRFSAWNFITAMTFTPELGACYLQT